MLPLTSALYHLSTHGFGVLDALLYHQKIPLVRSFACVYFTLFFSSQSQFPERSMRVSLTVLGDDTSPLAIPCSTLTYLFFIYLTYFLAYTIALLSCLHFFCFFPLLISLCAVCIRIFPARSSVLAGICFWCLQLLIKPRMNCVGASVRSWWFSVIDIVDENRCFLRLTYLPIYSFAVSVLF